MSFRWADPVQKNYSLADRAQPAGSGIHKNRPQSSRPSGSSQRSFTHDNKHAADVTVVESLMVNLSKLESEKTEAEKYIKSLQQELSEQNSKLKTLEAENDSQKRTISQLNYMKGKYDGRHETETSWQKEDDSPDMRRIKQVMDQLNKEVEGLEMKYIRRVEQLEEKASAQPLEADVSKYERRLNHYKEKLTKAEEENETLQEKARDVIQDLRNKKGELEITVRQLKQENSDLSDRLSQEMNVKVSSDESSMENISIKSRPMKIADSYNLFCTTEWLEIKSAIDEKQDQYNRVTESEICDCLCNILLVAHEKAVEFQQNVTERVLKVLHNPLDVHSHQVGGYRDPPKVLKSSQQLSNGIGDVLRASSETADLTKLVEKINDDLRRISNNIYRICWSGNPQRSMRKYIKGAATMAWQMVNQRPVMTYYKVQANEVFNKTTQEPHWGSADPTYGPTTVDCCVMPALCQGDRVMAKARVLLKLNTHYTADEHDV